MKGSNIRRKTLDSFDTVITSLDDLRRFAERLRKDLAEREILLLSGGLGAGKTQLVRYLVESAADAKSTGNSSVDVSSPTFAIHNHYETPIGPLDHIDLYRLESEDDLESTGFWDLFAQEAGLIIIEWADRLEEDALAPDWPLTRIHIEKQDDDSRHIRVTRLSRV